MNLLDKKKSIGALVLGLLLFISCEKNGPFGLDSDDVAPVEFSSVDIPVTSSVVWLDSIISSNVGTMLVGDYRNNTFGQLEATAYTRLSLNRAAIAILPSESVFDSVRMNLRFNYVYDTSNMSRNWGIDAFAIARGITDTLHITSDDALIADSLFASSKLEVINFDSTYAIPFNLRWAQEVFNRLLDADESVENQENFDRFFRGLAFKARTDVADNIFGIELSEESNVTLYYREPGISGEIDLNRAHVMTFAGSPNFYNLTADRAGTVTSPLDQFHVEVDPANSKRYIQAGAGLVTKIDISEFRNFIDASESARIINLAELTIGPIDDLGEEIPSPDALFLALTDDRNTLIRDGNTFRAVQSDGQSVIGNGGGVRLEYDPETKTYSASITSYIQSYFSGQFQRDEFFLYPNNMNTGTNGISFDAEDINLKIIFSELQ